MNFVLELAVNPFADLETDQDSDPKQLEQSSDDALKGPIDINKNSTECNETVSLCLYFNLGDNPDHITAFGIGRWEQMD